MATIKVFDSNGVKELLCFDTLSDVDYFAPAEYEGADEEVEDKNPFE